MSENLDKTNLYCKMQLIWSFLQVKHL